MPFTPTDEQAAILRAFARDDQPNLVVQARAGTGKTSTLRLLAEAAERNGRRGHYMAFNRAIVEAAVRSMPDNVEASTVHRLAMRAAGLPLRHRLAAPRLKGMENAKILRLNEPVWAAFQGRQKRISVGFMAAHVLRAIEKFCQSADTAPAVKHFPYIEGIDDTATDGRRTWANNNAVNEACLPALARAWADLTRPDGKLRFTHGIYLKMWELGHDLRDEAGNVTAHIGPRIPGIDFLLVDEAQDLAPVMLSIAQQQISQGVQVVFVGDSEQSIYGFTGAVDALARATKAGAETLYLTQSFRFGEEIADVANIMLTGLAADPLVIGNPLAEGAHVGAVGTATVILTRTNATAMRQVFAALATGVSVHLVGGGGQLVKFAQAAEQLKAGGWTSHPELTCFTSWQEVQDYVDEDPQGGDLKLLVDLVDEFGTQEIITALGNTVAAEDCDLTVTTAHKAKGLEWDSVQLAGDFTAEPSDEELRLLYVAVTRAKVALDVTRVVYLEQYLNADERAVSVVEGVEIAAEAAEDAAITRARAALR